VPDDTITAAHVTDLVQVGTPDTPSDLDGAMDDFFSQPLDGTTGTGRARLVRGLDGGRSALLIKLHHATADGIAVIGALVGRTRDQQFIVDTPAPATRPTTRQRLADAREIATGLWTLARAGKAPKSPLNGPVRSAARHHATVELPIAEVRQVAKALRTKAPDLAVALVAEALHRVVPSGSADHLRVAMPRSTRTTKTFRSSGNHTGAASVDLPIGPMSFAERIERTHKATQQQVTSSAPRAAHTVVRMVGLLPPFLHARVARRMYRSTWFNAIASVLPGARSPVILRGARMSVVYPVLALAPGVKLSVGVMTWADLLTMCFTGDVDTAGSVDALADAVYAAFKEAKAVTA
jgi:hypothetical protein